MTDQRGPSPTDDLAESSYELAFVVKGPSGLRILGAVIEGMLTSGAGTPVASKYFHQVKDRLDGRIVYEVETTNGLADAEAAGMIRRDLAALTVADFNRQYGIVR